MQYYGYKNLIYVNIYSDQCRNYEYMSTLEIRGTPRRTKYRLNCKNGPTSQSTTYTPSTKP